MRISIRVMMRQLAVTLLSACLIIIPMSAQAMGFGNIRIKSSLNEPLDAEIELLSATESDLKGLNIKMASQEAFLRAGIERPGHLSQLKFSIKRHSSGRAYLQITTAQSVREPFLDFLLEMNWKNGRMLREYTVLLDPPDRKAQQQPTIVESPQTESPLAVAEQEQQQTSTPFVEPEPVESAQVEPEPEPIMAEKAQVSPEPAVADEPLMADSIAAADVESEPVPLSESIPEKELQLAEEPVVAEPVSIAGADEQAAPATEESVAEADIDPFAGEKFPRIPIKLDKRLRQAEEAELQAIEIPGEPALEQTSLAAEPAAADESFKEEALKPEQAPVPDDAVASLEPEETARDAVDSITTKRNDKLWNIAQAMRPDESVSIYQVMMALLQNNPEAFVDNNVHRLKVGKVLRIEDPSVLTAMSQHQAAQQYIAQTQAWDEYRQQFTASSSSTPMQAEMAGEVSSPISEAQPEQAPIESGELVLAAPEGDNQTAGSTNNQQATVNNEVVILREEIRQTLAEAEAEGNKNVVLNEKLRDLESQLQELQRSVTVQDDELATLQKQLSDLNKKNIEAEQADPVVPYSEIPGLAATPEAKAPDAAVMSEADMLAQSQQQATAEQNKSEAAQVAESAPVVEPTPAAEPAKDTGVVDTTFGVLDSIKQTLSGIVSSLPVSPLILAIGGGVIVVLLLLMLLLVQRRRQAANFQESILSGIPSHEIMASEEASLETNLSGESSFLSDFAISGASALQGDDGDVDPLTEADVFMAYGRYEAAEERILEAIKKDPGRQELRIKLLELYNTTKNKTAFESAAAALYENLGNDAANPLWQKVVAMGAILAADNPLFSDMQSDVTRIRKTEDATQIRNQTADAAKDMPELDFEDSNSIDGLGLDLDFGSDDEQSVALDFDFDTSGEDTAQVEQAKKDDLGLNLESEDSMQIDVSGLDFEIPTNETDAAKPVNLDMSGEDTAQTEVALELDLPDGETAEVNLDAGLDFDMGEIEDDINGLDLRLDENDESSMGLTMDLDLDTAMAKQKDDGLTMEMSQPTFNEMEMPTMEAEVDATDMSDLDTPSIMDEVGTKLDLAKAYIDMGDPDGARSILDEVLEEGTAPQQQEAQQLMQQI